MEELGLNLKMWLHLDLEELLLKKIKKKGSFRSLWIFCFEGVMLKVK